MAGLRVREHGKRGWGDAVVKVTSRVERIWGMSRMVDWHGLVEACMFVRHHGKAAQHHRTQTTSASLAGCCSLKPSPGFRS